MFRDHDGHIVRVTTGACIPGHKFFSLCCDDVFDLAIDHTHIMRRYGKCLRINVYVVTRQIFHAVANRTALFIVVQPHIHWFGLGHVVQYKAIEEMKVRGLRCYKIGLRCYPQDDGVTEKDITISEFKQGFSTHLFPQFVLQHIVESVSSG